MSAIYRQYEIMKVVDKKELSTYSDLANELNTSSQAIHYNMSSLLNGDFIQKEESFQLTTKGKTCLPLIEKLIENKFIKGER